MMGGGRRPGRGGVGARPRGPQGSWRPRAPPSAGVTLRGGDLPRSDMGGPGTCGTPGGGTWGREGVLGGRGRCIVPNPPHGPAAPTFGPEEGEGCRDMHGDGVSPAPPGRAVPRWPPQPPSHPPRALPLPPWALYRALIPRTHTRDPRGTRGTPKKAKNPTATGARRKQNPTGAGRGRPGGALARPRGAGGAQRDPPSLLVLELISEPVEALVEPVPAGGTGGLDVPVTVAQGVQPQLVRDLCCVHGIGQVLQQTREVTQRPDTAAKDTTPPRGLAPALTPWGWAQPCHRGSS